MKAVICHNAKLEVVELPEAVPGPRQIVLEVTGCGICGSDLHARRYADTQADVLAEAGYDGFMRSAQRVVMGHEFCGRIAGYGPESAKRFSVGTSVVSMPLIRRGGEMHAIGLSASAPGGYAEQVVVEESLSCSPCPMGSPPRSPCSPSRWPSAITPFAAPISPRKTSPSSIGCGPVGLAVIANLKARGVRTIVASDFSAQRRRSGNRVRR